MTERTPWTPETLAKRLDGISAWKNDEFTDWDAEFPGLTKQMESDGIVIASAGYGYFNLAGAVTEEVNLAGDRVYCVVDEDGHRWTGDDIEDDPERLFRWINDIPHPKCGGEDWRIFFSLGCMKPSGIDSDDVLDIVPNFPHVKFYITENDDITCRAAIFYKKTLDDLILKVREILTIKSKISRGKSDISRINKEIQKIRGL